MLEAYRIIEITDERGYLAGKILADMGAEVIKIEPPGGDAGRRHGPFAGRDRDPEASLPWLAMNTGKHSVVLDLDDSDGRGNLADLIRNADVLLETKGPRGMKALDLSRERLLTLNPALVHCAITPFGSDGPYSEFVAEDLVVVAMGGNASMTGEADSAPLRCTMPTSTFHAGPEAVVGILTALHARRKGQLGCYVDVSMQECQVATTMAGPATWALGKGLGKRSGARIGRTREIWRAKDGWISFGLRGGPARARNLVAICEYMRDSDLLPEWLDGYDWNSYNHMALGAEELERLEDSFAAFFASKTMRELYQEALSRRILLAPCNNAAEILEHEQLRSRSFFRTLDYPHLGLQIEHPSGFAKVDKGHMGVARRAPKIGEHDDALPSFLSRPANTAPTTQGPETHEGTALDGIYADLKILEFGSGAAGPVATRYFADRGATVLRVESAKRPDFLRHLHMTKDAAYGLNGAPMFITLNANKKSVAIDMSKAEGIELAKRLVEWADVINENFAPGVMEKWGLDARSIHAINPSAITISGSLFGLTGPQRHYPGFGGQGSAIAGFNHLTGRADGEAHGPYGTITDSLAPRYSAALISAALLQRESNGGLGESIDLSQIESGVYSLSEMIVRFSATGIGVDRNGNHHPSAAPHAIYPCLGEDRWLAIAVFADDEWKALCTVAGDAEWTRDSRFANASGRLANEATLDEGISQWTQSQDAYDLMQRLQSVGVGAGVVQTYEDLLGDPQLRHRGHFAERQHRHLGPMQLERSGYRLCRDGGEISAPGPDLGEHTQTVLADLLGMSRAEIDELERKEVLT